MVCGKYSVNVSNYYYCQLIKFSVAFIPYDPLGRGCKLIAHELDAVYMSRAFKIFALVTAFKYERFLSLSLSLSHTHTHTHTHIISNFALMWEVMQHRACISTRQLWAREEGLLQRVSLASLQNPCHARFLPCVSLGSWSYLHVPLLSHTLQSTSKQEPSMLFYKTYKIGS